MTISEILTRGRARLEASGGTPDWARHLLGLSCARPVLTHEFLSGSALGFSPARCVRLAHETDPWCGVPRRCHLAAAGAPPSWWFTFRHGFPQQPSRDQEGCPACGSESRAERGYVGGRTGQPVTCPDDWHDDDAREPGGLSVEAQP